MLRLTKLAPPLDAGPAWEFPDHDLREKPSNTKKHSMGKSILIVGASGTGKSASLRNLPPKETFIVNVASKPLPFKAKGYAPLSEDGETGNVYVSDVSAKIVGVLDHVNADRKEIKYIVIDDAQYIMANSYMEKAMEKGYEKFSQIGQDFYKIAKKVTSLRPDLHVALMFHDDTSMGADGKKIRNAKTIGKMFDQYITLEGLFSVVLFTKTTFSKEKKMSYEFATQTDGETTAKSPMGLFEKNPIENDLKMVFDAMDAYYEDDPEPSTSAVEQVVPTPTVIVGTDEVESTETQEEGDASLEFGANVEDLTGPGYPDNKQDTIDLIMKNEDVLKEGKVKGWTTQPHRMKSRGAYMNGGNLLDAELPQLHRYLKFLQTTIDGLPD